MSVVWLLVALAAQVVFAFDDPAINESSGLVDLGSTMVTTNDSGGDPLVFVVDARTGETVGRTTFADEVEDVEALAPAGPDAVWVADIGDNREARDSVQVYRVPVGPGDRTVDAPAYELVYPDGAQDAESLVVGPGGRLFVITKGLLGGTAYAAPLRLDRAGPNQLRAVAGVNIWATDAAMFPDGRHVVVRGYDGAVVLTFPGFQPVGSFDLPRQQQGEGISVGDSGRIRISSEGERSEVLQVPLPDELEAAIADRPDTATASPEPAPDPTVVFDEESSSDPTRTQLLVVGGTLVVLVGAVVLVGRARRRRGGTP